MGAGELNPESHHMTFCSFPGFDLEASAIQASGYSMLEALIAYRPSAPCLPCYHIAIKEGVTVPMWATARAQAKHAEDQGVFSSGQVHSAFGRRFAHTDLNNRWRAG